MMRVGVMAGLSGLLLVAPAHAWIFGDKDKGDEDKQKGKPAEVVMPPSAPVSAPPAESRIAPVRTAATNAPAESRLLARPHMRFTKPEDEKQLLTFINARRRAQEDYAVVTRLIEEKNLEIRTFNLQMKEQFGIDPELNYQFDADTGAILQLTMKPGLTEEQKRQTTINAEQLKDFYDFTTLRTLTNEVERTRFMRLAAGKQLASDQIRVLLLLQNEKEIENNTLHEEMATRYAISMDREYRYDNDSKTLFELVLVPKDYVEPTADEKAPKKSN